MLWTFNPIRPLLVNHCSNICERMSEKKHSPSHVPFRDCYQFGIIIFEQLSPTFFITNVPGFGLSILEPMILK